MLFRAISVLVALSLFAMPAMAGKARAYPQVVNGPAVTFESNRVIADAATPGATIYFVGISITNVDSMPVIEREGGPAVADSEGIARYTTKKPVRTRSVWIAVMQGGYTVAAPEGMVLREVPLPADALQNNQLRVGQYAAEVAMVRRGIGGGIWMAPVRDGGSGDDGGANGEVLVGLPTLQSPPPNAGPGPIETQTSDVFFVVNPFSLEYGVLVTEE